jgi:hypothetical protein
MATGAATPIVLIDAKRLKPLSISVGREHIADVALATGLLEVETPEGFGHERVVRINANGTLDQSTFAECSLWREDIDDQLGTAVVSCRKGGGTWLLREDQPPRHLEQELSGRLVGSVVALADSGVLAFYSAKDGTLLPYSPEYPLRLHGEGYWDERARQLIVGLSEEPLTAVVTFLPELKLSYAAELAKSCGGEETWLNNGGVTWGTKPPYPLCDRRTGQRLRDLPFREPPDQFERSDVSADGQFMLTRQRAGQLYEIATGRSVSLAESPEWLKFAGDALVGYNAEGHGVWDRSTGRRIAGFSERGELPIAADAELELAIIEKRGEQLGVYGFAAGPRLAELRALPRGDVRFGPAGLLSIVEADWVSLWRLPAAKKIVRGQAPRRLGRLMFGESGLAFLADDGAFQASGKTLKWLRCEVGLTELPIELCVDALTKPDLLQSLWPK